MKFIKTSSLLLPIAVFAIFLALSMLNIFELHHETAGENFYTDHLFYYSINSIAWLSGAFLLNLLINTFIWGGLFKRLSSNSFNQVIIDFISVVIYVFALLGILVKVAGTALTPFWITIAFTILVLGTAFRRRALDLSSGSLFTTDKPFNIGDWIEIVDNSIGRVEGEVTDIKMRNIKLKSADNSVIVIPQSILTNVVVKNYTGISDETKVELLFNLSSAYPSQRVTRVLMASVVDALIEQQLSNSKVPEISINGTNELGVEYSVKYYLSSKIFAEKAKINDVIYSKVLNHLTITGMKLISRDSIFPTEQGYFQFGYDKRLILLHNELFRVFTKNEIDKLSENIAINSIQKDANLITQGDSGESMFLIVEGLFKVTMKTENNKEIELAILSPGGYLGEMSLFTGEPRSATVTALSDSIVCEIKKENIQEILTNRIELAEVISNTIAERTTMNIQAIEDAGKKQKHFYDNILSNIKSFFNL